MKILDSISKKLLESDRVRHAIVKYEESSPTRKKAVDAAHYAAGAAFGFALFATACKVASTLSEDETNSD